MNAKDTYVYQIIVTVPDKETAEKCASHIKKKHGYNTEIRLATVEK